MAKRIIEGIELSSKIPVSTNSHRAPVVTLPNGLILDDHVLESPTLILGSVGSGKTVLLNEIMEGICEYAAKVKDNVVIFCAKKNLLKFARPSDLVIAIDSNDPRCCWNIFREMEASKNPDLTVRDIAKILFKDQRSETQPFFVNAAQDIFIQTLRFMYRYSKKIQDSYDNFELIRFLEDTKMWREKEEDPLSWHDFAKIYPEYYGHLRDYLGNDADQGFGVMSEIRTLISEAFFGSFCKKDGCFSAIEALKTGDSRILLYYDQANASEASLKIFQCILDLLFKHSVDDENGRKTWFFIDEASLLPRSNALIDAMSYGRESGFRLFMCLQSAQLMTRRYTESEAKSILSLFPNLISLRVQDDMSRKLFADRYGKSLYEYNYSSVGLKSATTQRERYVVDDTDFFALSKKGMALCSLPALSSLPFIYDGYRKEIDK